MNFNSARTWLRRVFGVVEDQHVRRGSLGGDDAGILGHVASSVHLTFMVDLDLNLYFTTDWTKATELCQRKHSNEPLNCGLVWGGVHVIMMVVVIIMLNLRCVIVFFY